MLILELQKINNLINFYGIGIHKIKKLNKMIYSKDLLLYQYQWILYMDLNVIKEEKLYFMFINIEMRITNHKIL